MNAQLLDLLKCPECGTFDLELDVFDASRDEIENALIGCPSCGSTFPVILGVPRMLPCDLGASLPGSYPDWYGRYGERTSASDTSTIESSSRRDLERATMESFGYQWNVFDDLYPEWRDDFLQFSPPELEESFFVDKLGLDAGCGMGRHTRVCASFGARMVGIDISGAVDAARRNTRDLRDVEIVQGEIARHPFREGVFDFAYSFGVLHHLRDPVEGFNALARIPRELGTLFIWVYSNTRNPIYAKMRLVTRHFPFPLLRAFCLILAVGVWMMFVLPNRAIRRLELRSLMRFTKFDFYARHPFRVMHADFFDEMSAPIIHEHTGDEVSGWFTAAGYRGIRTSSTSGLGWRGIGERICVASAEA
jgi:SAM-dependent methyltransferase/uncharacterized protein YbaR (Trm112 family)